LTSIKSMAISTKPIDSILRVSGTKIVDGHGHEIILKGAGLGGHLNMENFITGYSGAEFQHRKAMRDILGPEKSDFFFDRFLDYFFTDADAKFFASLGLNCIRIPFNHKHFEDDLNPGIYKQSGLDLLDRVVQHCTNNNLYVIFDLHTVPGGQNQDWHSDTGLNRALFWEYKEFQDRVINLWVEIAQRYKGNPFVAGYNPLNEPADPEHTNLIRFYNRVEQAIRAVDPDHILYIDGNTYAMDFSQFPSTPLPNSVYACHDYNFMGFPTGDAYLGTDAQKQKLRKSFERKVRYMREHGIPIWNGEFGPVYASAADAKGSTAAEREANAARENSCRFAMLEEQLKIYAESSVSWSIWLYKDIGYQGMTYVSPDSPYMRLISPFLAKKKKLGLDFWGSSDKSGVADVYDPFISSLKAMVPEHLHNKRYPSPQWSFERQVERCVREGLMSEYLGLEMAELFEGKTLEELDELASSFKLENCVARQELNEILRRDAERGQGTNGGLSNGLRNGLSNGQKA
jgi:aryl-phospho-beta-D-glucosidase BglC (GH1 family)